MREIILKDNGELSLRTIQEHKVINKDAVLASCGLDKAPIINTYKDLTFVTHVLYGVCTVKTHSSLSFRMELNKEVDDNGMPQYRRVDKDGDCSEVVTIPAPENCIFFTAWIQGEFYAVIYDTKQELLRRLPLCNVYNTGKLCLGDSYNDDPMRLCPVRGHYLGLIYNTATYSNDDLTPQVNFSTIVNVELKVMNWDRDIVERMDITDEARICAIIKEVL